MLSQVHAGSLKVVSCCGFGVDDPLLSPFVRPQAHAGSLKVVLESKLEVEDAFDEDAAPSGVKVEVGDRGEPGPGLGVGVGVELGESPTLRVGEVVWFDLAGGDGKSCGDGKTKVLVGEVGGGVVGEDGLSDIVNPSVCSSIVSNDEGRGGEDGGGGEGVFVALFIDEERRIVGMFWIRL